ncbi:hypothetical protein SAMN05421847_0802 [Halpernia humi]|uniref:C1q domain-containing protein n=1 Tax=Halpernia humi TaxID=493375 RepID=A0A1H5UHQ8_9FLAO|nr:hypothetical protein [Halpernia humi]SEF74566.1 hypothetical protein SAMN05421847_0802 [Halpernia humi]
MKKIIFYIILLIFGLGKAQYVGINTDLPKATLDVVGKPTDAAVSDGIIAPRLTLAQLNAKTNYGAAQTGSIVYVSDITGATVAATARVLSVGYYYFDGVIWQPLNQQNSSPVFTASLGSGAGGTTNATIAANGFNTVPLPTVVSNVGGGVWNGAPNYTYTVAKSGTYIIKSSIRLVDGSSARNIFQAVGVSNADIPDGIWQTNSGNRWTMLYTRIAFFNKGDVLRLYIYSAGAVANLSDASLNIALINQF